ncbi:MAG: hypothetical protein CMK36_04745 [Porticoccaceae bacterium]|nr:hypothetical protein [Porticoccaceae bacterium]
MTYKNRVKSIFLVVAMSGSGTGLTHDGIHTWNEVSASAHFLFNFVYFSEIFITGITFIWIALMYRKIQQRPFKCFKVDQLLYVD